MTIEEAKQVLRDGVEDGVECPCCHQYVKLYRRPMHAQQAKMLIELFKLGPGWHKAHDFTDGSGEFSKLRFWGLVEEERPNLGEGRTSGAWRITTLGRSFVSGHALVPARVRIFNKQFYGLEGDPVLITHVLGNKFNYDDLMGNASRGQWL